MSKCQGRKLKVIDLENKTCTTKCDLYIEKLNVKQHKHLNRKKNKWATSNSTLSLHDWIKSDIQ